MPDPFAEFDLSQHIIYEDNYLLVLNKPAGLSTEGSLGLAGFVSAYLEEKYPWKKQLITGVAHRLDRRVSDLIVFAKTKMALRSLNAQFAKRSMAKRYLAVCENIPEQKEGELSHWLVKDREARKARLADDKAPGAKAAHLKYSLLQTANNYSLLEVELLTGRYHQIRAQLAAAGYPIVGDELYGGPADAGYAFGIYLHSHLLQLEHPKTGEQMEFTQAPAQTGKWNLFKLPR
jgi:23S rRNA pseudouridine1911/1915/1917 synthase